MHLLQGKDVSKWKKSSKEKKRKHERKENPNKTLNLLVSLNGVEYYNMLDGAPILFSFRISLKKLRIQSIFEVVCESGRKMLEDYLPEMGIDFLYTPVYSPDITAELCFNKVETRLNYHFQKVFKANLKLATALALETITMEDRHNFYNMAS